MSVMDNTWQGPLVKVAAFLVCVGCLVVLIGVLHTVYNPDGPGGAEPASLDVAGVLTVQTATGAVLLLVACIFKEKDTLDYRLPSCSLTASACIVLLFSLLLPVTHAMYAVAILTALVFAILSKLREPLQRLRAFATLDAILCLAFSAIMVHVGPTTDFSAARAIVGLYACLGGGLLPGMSWLVSYIFAPRLAWAVVVGYVLASLHAAIVLLQALGTALYDAFGSSTVAYGSASCLGDVGSPLEWGLSMLAKHVEASPLKGARGVVRCRAQEAASAIDIDWSGDCDSLHPGLVVLAFLVGVWLSCVIVFRYCWKPEAQVLPDFESGLAASIPFWTKRRICIMVLVGCGFAFGALGYLGFWTCPGTSDDEGMVTAIGLNSTTTTTQTYTMTTVTTTTFTTTTEEGYNATGEINETENESSTNSSNDTAGAPEEDCEEEDPLVVGNTRPGSPRGTGCLCRQPDERGLVKWAAVPVEHLASVWCDLGNLAAAMVGFFLYCCHAFTCSLAYFQARSYSDQQRQIAHRKQIEKIRLKAIREGRAGGTPEDEGRIVLWSEAPRDPLPRSQFAVGDERVFNI